MMYADLLVKIKNAQDAHKNAVFVPYSKSNLAIVQILEKGGFVGKTEVKKRTPYNKIEIKLEKDEKLKLKFFSTPARNLYAKCEELSFLRKGIGMLVLSTSRGIVNGKEARANKVGGKLLFKIWKEPRIK